MKTISEADARKLAGVDGAKIILEAFASGEQITDPIYMRLHYVNTRLDQDFYQKEPFIVVPIDCMVEKLNYACFMSAALKADLTLEISGPKWLTERLDAACKEIIPLMSQQYGMDVLETEPEDVSSDPVADEVRVLGREVIQKILGKKIPAGVNIQLISIRNPEELEQFLTMLGTGSLKGGANCGCSDCTGTR